MSPTENLRLAAQETRVQPLFERHALALCVLASLWGSAVEASGYSEQGRLHDAASWRSEEFKSNWGLGAVGADFAYARGLSGAGGRRGVYQA